MKEKKSKRSSGKRMVKGKYPVPLSDEEREIMIWASDAFRKPWFTLVDLMSKIQSGEKLSSYMFDPYFIKVKLDARLAYWFMKTTFAAKMAFGPNGNLLTIILSSSEDKVIWACIEREEKGIYLDYEILNDRLNEKWAEDVAKMLWINDLSSAFDYMSMWLKNQKDLSYINLGVMKVANIRFFQAIKIAYERSNNGENLPLFLLKGVEAVKDILERGWIRFYPDVPLQKLLRTIRPILKNTTYINKVMQSAARSEVFTGLSEKLYNNIKRVNLTI